MIRWCNAEKQLGTRPSTAPGSKRERKKGTRGFVHTRIWREEAKAAKTPISGANAIVRLDAVCISGKKRAYRSPKSGVAKEGVGDGCGTEHGA